MPPSPRELAIKRWSDELDIACPFYGSRKIAIKEEQGTKMENTTILLMEDNPHDEALTLRALKKNKIENNVFVVRDGVEALDFLFCTNPMLTVIPMTCPSSSYCISNYPR